MDWGDSGVGGGSGGFINDSIVEDQAHYGQPSNVGVGEDKNKAITAVSISQIAKLTRPNEGLVIHGKKIYHVNLVALVHEILDLNPTKIHVLLDDYTSGGPLEVSHIIGDSGSPDENPELSMFHPGSNPGSANGPPRGIHELKLGDYVRCIGVVKFNQDKANLVAYNVRIVNDPNEITTHVLEVIRDSMYYERLQSGAIAVGQPLNEKPATTNHQQAPPSKDGGTFGNLSTRDKHLLKFLRERASENGMSIKDIAENFKAFSRKDIEDSMSFLSAEGLCWQGDSEDIWCVNPTD